MNDEKLGQVFEDIDAVCRKHGVTIADVGMNGEPADFPAKLMVTEVRDHEKPRFFCRLCANMSIGYTR